jgi:DeoR/GlpR family transcriptional regulator of sugar metabolism
MDVQERRKFIAEQVATLGEVEFAQLAEICDVSEMTIRRDIETLERAGALRRVVGGAIAVGGTAQEPPFQFRASLAAPEKEHIAHAVVDLLSSGETVVLDSGSTVLSVAREIRRRAITLTVITPSVLVALELSDCDAIDVHLLGGLLRPGELSLIGPDTVEQLNQFNCDTAVLGVAGVDVAGGISDYHRDEAYVKKAAICAARRTVVAADHSKLGRSSLIKIAGLEEISVIVTDGRLIHPTLVEAQARGVSVIAVRPKEEVAP